MRGADDAPAGELARAEDWLTAQGIAVPGAGDSHPRERPVEPVGQANPAGSSSGRRRVAETGNGRARDAGAEHTDTKPTDKEPTDDDSEADPESVARTIVTRKLAARACTRHELERALAARRVPADVADRVLDRMEELRLVDDAAFAIDWVASRQQRRHLSTRALARELDQRGVDREQVTAALATVDPDDEYTAALALARRRAAGTTGLPFEVRYRRLAGVLARRGFGSATSARVLSAVLRRSTSDEGEVSVDD